MHCDLATTLYSFPNSFVRQDCGCIFKSSQPEEERCLFHWVWSLPRISGEGAEHKTAVDGFIHIATRNSASPCLRPRQRSLAANGLTRATAIASEVHASLSVCSFHAGSHLDGVTNPGATRAGCKDGCCGNDPSRVRAASTDCATSGGQKELGHPPSPKPHPQIDEDKLNSDPRNQSSSCTAHAMVARSALATVGDSPDASSRGQPTSAYVIASRANNGMSRIQKRKGQPHHPPQGSVFGNCAQWVYLVGPCPSIVWKWYSTVSKVLPSGSWNDTSVKRDGPGKSWTVCIYGVSGSCEARSATSKPHLQQASQEREGVRLQVSKASIG
eukprot:6477322-Amphidinium_carterae.1